MQFAVIGSPSIVIFTTSIYGVFMNPERTESMRAAMEKQGFDALLCRLPENVLLLSGYWPLCGWVFYLFPVDGRPVCILPNTEEEEALSELWDAECVTS